jgi:hypothetical protein
MDTAPEGSGGVSTVDDDQGDDDNGNDNSIDCGEGWTAITDSNNGNDNSSDGGVFAGGADVDVGRKPSPAPSPLRRDRFGDAPPSSTGSDDADPEGEPFGLFNPIRDIGDILRGFVGLAPSKPRPAFGDSEIVLDFGNPNRRPGPEWDWNPPGNPKGQWHNKRTDESLRPALDDPFHGPHFDYKDTMGKTWRLYAFEPWIEGKR